MELGKVFYYDYKNTTVVTVLFAVSFYVTKYFILNITIFSHFH
jgi:hypothetical protein